MYDVAIIGAGVTGCAVAFELSKYKLDICVIEKETDVCEGTSKANSGIANAGYDPKPGTLCAKLNARGAEMIREYADEWGVDYKPNGTMVVCSDPSLSGEIDRLYEQGTINGVKGLKILTREEALELEPNLSDLVCRALLIEAGGILCPFSLTIAFAEMAYENGAQFLLGEEVTNVEKTGDHYTVTTPSSVIEARFVINAAGVYADRIHNMVSADKLHITPRRGEYCLMDKIPEGYLTHTIFPVPSPMGKGIIVSPTVHGNMLIGPTAENLDDPEDIATTAEGIASVIKMSANSVKDIPYHTIITSFAGLRAQEDRDDFIIEEVKDSPGFIDCAGIKSPGLASSPTIAIYVADLLNGITPIEKKESFVSSRKPITKFKELSREEQEALIKKDPAYGRIVCRCESITEGEILEAIRRPLGARTMDGIKRRVRAGMGRCQGGFCTPRVMEILARETGQTMAEIQKNRPSSGLIKGTLKED